MAFGWLQVLAANLGVVRALPSVLTALSEIAVLNRDIFKDESDSVCDFIVNDLLKSKSEASGKKVLR